MTIEIQDREIEEIIRQRLESGGFRDAEDVVGQALRVAPMAGSPQSDASRRSCFTGADLIAAMQACPHPDFDMEQPRYASPVRDVEL